MKQRIFRKMSHLSILFALVFALSACAGGGNGTAPVADKAGSVSGLYTDTVDKFSVNYPPNWETKPLKGDEVLRAVNNNPWGVPLMVVAASDLKPGAADLKDAAPGYFESIKKDSPSAGRFKIFSQEMIKLNDGTDALSMTFKWSLDSTTKLQSALVMTYKNNRVISVLTTTILGGDTSPDKLLAMAKTFKFL